MWKACFISQTLALSYMCGTISRFVPDISTNTPGPLTFVAHVICHRLCFLLQLLWHEGGVPRHGDNGFSLRRRHRLLLPNQSERMKRLLCLWLVRGRLLSVEKNLFVSCCCAAHGWNIHGICDQQQMQRFCCIKGWRSCFRASLNLNFSLILWITFPTTQVDFTSCGGFLCIAAVVLMVIGVVTAIVLSFQYVRTCRPETLSSPLVSRWGVVYLCPW